MANSALPTSEGKNEGSGISDLESLLERVKVYDPNHLDIITKAYEFSNQAHSGQYRRSGEAYISHPLSVAGILAELKLDYPTVITGLLHDTVEDTAATLEEIESRFGKDVAHLVDGVTKISKINFRNTHEKQGENIRKMIVAMGKDIRVVLVKLADRLHNMRTLNHMSYEKQALIAQETLDIYAPLANRLGINAWKCELEDLSLRYLRPDLYYELAQKVARKKKEREKFIDEMKKMLFQNMAAAKIPCEISGRPKHLYSIYKKMQARNLDYDQIYDVLAFRVCVDSIAQCYEALGVVHSIYKPIPGRFKDFIAMAKANNYQSLHTTVIGSEGERTEIQIRTHEMHLVAERGIAAHWKYKEGGGGVDAKTEQTFSWLRDLVSWHQQSHDSDEFLENIKGDLFESEIYVFTPKGDVKAFPDGATPIDFAYSVHTDLGSKVTGARVNGRIVPLKYQLQSGDTIEVLSSPNQQPSKDWLKFCVTTKAQSKIRSYIKNEERKRSVEMGQDLLEKEFRKAGANYSKYLKDGGEEKALKAFGVGDLPELFMQIGYGKIISSKVLELLAPDLKAPQEAPPPDTFLGKVFKSALRKTRKNSSLVKVDGLEDLLVRYAKCCNPIPGDPIVGFISRGRGVTIHQSSCRKVYEVDTERRIDVTWTSGPETERQTKVKVISQDAPGLLRLMSECFATNGVNINNAQIRTNKDKKALCFFDVSVKDVGQLLKVIQDLQKIKGVIEVERINFS